MRAMSALGRDMAVAIAEALDLPPTYFLPHFDRPTLFLRLLHYPEQQREEGLFGSAPHTDYGFITLLAQDSSAGSRSATAPATGSRRRRSRTPS